MVDIEEVYVRDLYKEHKGKELHKGSLSQRRPFRMIEK
jgi:hypothetical protein